MTYTTEMPNSTYNIQHGSRFHLTRSLPSLSVLSHHFSQRQTVWTFVISHDLASLEDGLLSCKFEPGPLFRLSFQEASFPVIVNRVNDFGGNTSLGGMVPRLEVRLMGKAQGTEFFVALMSVIERHSVRFVKGRRDPWSDGGQQFLPRGS